MNGLSIKTGQREYLRIRDKEFKCSEVGLEIMNKEESSIIRENSEIRTCEVRDKRYCWKGVAAID